MSQDYYNRKKIQLMDMIISGKSFQEIIDELEKILDNPIRFSDDLATIHICSPNYPKSDLEQLLNYRFGGNTEDYYNCIIRPFLDNVHTAILESPSLDKRRIISLCKKDERLIGNICIPEIDRPLESFDMELIHMIADILAIPAILNEVVEVDSMSEKKLKLLLNTNIISQPHLKIITQGTIMDKIKNFAIIYARFEYSIDSYFLLRIKQLFTDSWININDKEFIILYDSAKNRFDQLNQYTQLYKILDDFSGYCCISDEFYNLREAKKQFERTRSALTFAHGGKKRILYLNDYKFHVFYTEIEKPFDYCLEFVDNRITHLDKYDSENNTEYLHTIKEYLKSNYNVNETAKTLNVHKNTVIYRLSKIKELFSLNLNNHKDIYSTESSLRLIELAGLDRI